MGWKLDPTEDPRLALDTSRKSFLLIASIMKNPALCKNLIVALLLFLPAGACFADNADDLINKGDVYDQKLNPTEALKYYLPAEKMEPQNVDVLLRIARQYRHQTADTADVNEKIRLSGIALGYAKRAVALAPKSSEAHLSVAICHAKSLEFYTNKEKMEALRQVKIFADKAVSLDPANDLAWYILGRWHQRVADLGTLKRKVAEMAYGGLPKASNDDAAKCYNKAISINPNRSPYLVDLGITYASMAKADDAKKFIKMGLSMPSTGKDDPDAKKRGNETLKTLK
jgi:tetratricopeptide (TPR) repeat protein